MVALRPDLIFGTSGTGPLREPEVPAPLALLLVAALAATVFAVAWLLLGRSGHLALATFALLAVAVPAAAFVSYELWHYHEDPEFCSDTCHVMEPAVESYYNPGRNLVMLKHHENETAKCLDCHTGPGSGGQVDLMLTSARHVWKYWVTKDYDPEDLGGDDWSTTVPDANCVKCHSPMGDSPLPARHERYQEDCADCHSPHDPQETGYFFPARILETEDCTFCHDDKGDSFHEELAAHADLEKGCRSCHDGHGLKTPTNVRGCTDAGCHDEQAAGGAALDPAKHAEGGACENCHQSGHEPLKLHYDNLQQACQSCHPAASSTAVSAASPSDHRTIERLSCSDCHAKHDQEVVACADCHATSMRGGKAVVPGHAPVDAQACVDCHGPAHEMSAVGRAGLEEGCTDCHAAETKAIHAKPALHSALAEVSCTTCHAPHGLAGLTSSGPGRPEPDSNLVGVAGCDASGCHLGDALESVGHADFPVAQCQSCHGSGHDVRMPSFKQLESCADCHTQQPTGDHAKLGGDCKACHTDHTRGAVKLPSCLDAGCHGPGTPWSLRQLGHMEVPADECGSCHGTAHDITHPDPAGLDGTCNDCHASQQATVVASPHASVLTLDASGVATGCRNCHVPEGDHLGVGECTVCHVAEATDPNHLAGLPDHAASIGDCVDCHGGHQLVFPSFEQIQDSCQQCHVGTPLPAAPGGRANSHTALAEEGCDNCHKDHGDTQPSCMGAECHAQATLAQLPHDPGFGPDDCASCHGAAHEPQVPTFAQLESQCQDCHRVAGHNIHPEGTGASACSDCHQPAAAPSHADSPGHGEVDCQRCHAPPGPPAYTYTPESQVTWMRGPSGPSYGQWNTEGRGNHDPDSDCQDCHPAGGPQHPVYPETCDSACHQWLQPVIHQDGFTNAAGETPSYTGTQDPATLLAQSSQHGAIQDAFGCSGFCHNPNVDAETATLYHKTMKLGVDEPLLPEDLALLDPLAFESPGLEHGYVTSCPDCHTFSFSSPENIHLTHIPLVAAEKDYADTQSGYGSACDYCHSAGGDGTPTSGGGCYNCHLSGHWPQPAYWKLGFPDGQDAVMQTVDSIPIPTAEASPNTLYTALETADAVPFAHHIADWTQWSVEGGSIMDCDGCHSQS